MTPEMLLEALTDIEDHAIENARKPVLRNGLRRFAAVLTAAAVLAAMTITVLAVRGGGEWFLDFFALRNKGTLTDGQAASIFGKTQSPALSQTHDGCTVTLDSFIADPYRAYFRFRLELPQAVIEAMNNATVECRLQPEHFHLLEQESGIDLGGGGWYPLEDDDETDNILWFMYSFDLQQGFQELPALSEGIPYLLRLENLRLLYIIQGNDFEYVPVAAGLWEFDIAFDHISNESLELITEPVEYWMVADDQWEIPKVTRVHITSFELYALSAAIHYTAADPGVDPPPDDLAPCIVVMRDGTAMELIPYGTMYCMNEFHAPAPIVPEEVDYVLLPGGLKLEAPE